jgi:hypothetical protein
LAVHGGRIVQGLKAHHPHPDPTARAKNPTHPDVEKWDKGIEKYFGSPGVEFKDETGEAPRRAGAR